MGPAPLPFLVDIDCGDARNLLYLSRTGKYSRIVGFNYTGDGTHIPSGFDLFRGPVRFSQCLHIPWIIYSATSWDAAMDAVRQHGHPKTCLHHKVVPNPPEFVKTTITSYQLRNRTVKKK